LKYIGSDALLEEVAALEVTAVLAAGSAGGSSACNLAEVASPGEPRRTKQAKNNRVDPAMRNG
jgi:hypothetical protein